MDAGLARIEEPCGPGLGLVEEKAMGLVEEKAMGLMEKKAMARGKEKAKAYSGPNGF
jgi:hypothetical protein